MDIGRGVHIQIMHLDFIIKCCRISDVHKIMRVLHLIGEKLTLRFSMHTFVVRLHIHLT